MDQGCGDDVVFGRVFWQRRHCSRTKYRASLGHHGRCGHDVCGVQRRHCNGRGARVGYCTGTSFKMGSPRTSIQTQLQLDSTPSLRNGQTSVCPASGYSAWAATAAPPQPMLVPQGPRTDRRRLRLCPCQLRSQAAAMRARSNDSDRAWDSLTWSRLQLLGRARSIAGSVAPFDNMMRC